MLPKTFSFGKIAKRVFSELPSFRFRDKDATTHNAGDATKCSRQVTYKALKTPESNPPDFLGQLRMRFGSWAENGIKYDILNKAAPFGLINLSAQGDTGEHGTFYGTSWHGYRDYDVGWKQIDGKIKPVIFECKTKIGYGAQCMIRKTPYSKEFIIPEPDQEWGYSQQLSLYLRDAYQKTKDSKVFSEPIVDGVLLQLLYADGLACFLEFYFEYIPEKDVARCYRVYCEEYPECCGTLDITIDLKTIADHWKKMDGYLAKGKLAPPDYERKYDVNDPRMEDATKTDLQKALKGELLVGDMKCKYCGWKDKCAADLGIELEYSAAEKKVIKKLLAER